MNINNLHEDRIFESVFDGPTDWILNKREQRPNFVKGSLFPSVIDSDIKIQKLSDTKPIDSWEVQITEQDGLNFSIIHNYEEGTYSINGFRFDIAGDIEKVLLIYGDDYENHPIWRYLGTKPTSTDNCDEDYSENNFEQECSCCRGGGCRFCEPHRFADFDILY